MATGLRTLCVDIGGTGIKTLIVDPKGKPLTERLRVDTPRPATPRAVMPSSPYACVRSRVTTL